MFCNYCGSQLPDDAAFCTTCGKALTAPAAPVAPVEPVASAPVVEEAAPVYEAPAVPVAPVAEPAPVYVPTSTAYAQDVPSYNPMPTPVVEEKIVEKIPEENQPLSPWSYFWLQILFAVPVVGFIFLIVFSCNGSNINRRNFARSYWCGLLIVAAIVLVYVVIAIATGAALASEFR